MSERKHTWEGEIYVRPINRGICMLDTTPELYLDEWIEQYIPEYAKARVKLTLEIEAIQENAKDLEPGLPYE